jgi:hypothetical protein
VGWLVVILFDGKLTKISSESEQSKSDAVWIFRDKSTYILGVFANGPLRPVNRPSHVPGQYLTAWTG